MYAIRSYYADCENYRRAQRSGSFDDQQSLEAEIYEQVFELIDLLHDLIQHFAFWVHNEFGAFSSIDIKIRKNQEALSKIDRLNTLFAECTIRITSYNVCYTKLLRLIH